MKDLTSKDLQSIGVEYFESLGVIDTIEWAWRVYRVSVQLKDLRCCEGIVEGNSSPDGDLLEPDWSTFEFEEWTELRDFFNKELADEQADRKLDEQKGN